MKVREFSVHQRVSRVHAHRQQLREVAEEDEPKTHEAPAGHALEEIDAHH
jgi:hypothetical protein